MAKEPQFAPRDGNGNKRHPPPPPPPPPKSWGIPFLSTVHQQGEAMTASQEAFLDLLIDGLPIRAACRRLGISDSTPYRWAKTSQVFADAWAAARPRYRRRVIYGEWVAQFIGDLREAGFINPDLDERGIDDLQACVFRFFSDRQLLEPRGLQKEYNHSPVARTRQRDVVDAYIKLKLDGASDNRLHDFLVENGLSKHQISRWAKRWRGAGSLEVGPFTNGATRQRILTSLLAGPQDARTLADSISLNCITVRSQLNNLIAAGLVSKRKRSNEVTYART